MRSEAKAIAIGALCLFVFGGMLGFVVGRNHPTPEKARAADSVATARIRSAEARADSATVTLVHVAQLERVNDSLHLVNDSLGRAASTARQSATSTLARATATRNAIPVSDLEAAPLSIRVAMTACDSLRAEIPRIVLADSNAILGQRKELASQRKTIDSLKIAVNHLEASNADYAVGADSLKSEVRTLKGLIPRFGFRTGVIAGATATLAVTHWDAVASAAQSVISLFSRLHR
jgi:hypothetical protein